MSQGPTGGFDNCEQDAFCYFYDTSSDEGECVAFCRGDETNPQCPSGTACGYSNDGNVAFCRDTCNPIEQDCPRDNAICRDVNSGIDFACYVDAAGTSGEARAPCSLINGCQAGLVCTSAELVTDLDDPPFSFVCTPYCDLAEPECPDGLTCSPWFAEGDAPPDLEDVGICLDAAS